MINQISFDEAISYRLTEMIQKNDPKQTLWPENCEGSRNALVVFIGPSPGGNKVDERNDINLSKNKPLWNKPYQEPLNWSTGFHVSFKLIVEKIFKMPYSESSKLIARFNLDWMPNPESEDVSTSYMREGCSHVIPILSEIKPKLVIPMDRKTFGIVQDGLILEGFDVDPIVHDEIRIKIWKKDDSSSFHREIFAIKATKDDISFLVINSFQHPARIYDDQYALRIGKAIRLAADQIWNGEIVSIVIE